MKINEVGGNVEEIRDLMPPLTSFLEAHLNIVRTGFNVTPENGVGPRLSFRTPRQKLQVSKPPCYLSVGVT